MIDVLLTFLAICLAPFVLVAIAILLIIVITIFVGMYVAITEYLDSRKI